MLNAKLNKSLHLNCLGKNILDDTHMIFFRKLRKNHEANNIYILTKNTITPLSILSDKSNLIYLIGSERNYYYLQENENKVVNTYDGNSTTVLILDNFFLNRQDRITMSTILDNKCILAEPPVVQGEPPVVQGEPPVVQGEPPLALAEIIITRCRLT
jgi:hypothetical protein